jgi:hypothetical protein
VTDRPDYCGCGDTRIRGETQSEPAPVEPDDDTPGYDNWAVFDSPEGQAAGTSLSSGI